MADALKSLYEKHYGRPAEKVAPLKGDGSARKMFRLEGGGKPASVIGVVSPDPSETKAFLEFSKHFRKEGLPVPEIYAEDRSKGIYLEEDLGDETLFQLLSKSRGPDGLGADAIGVYHKVVDMLPRFQIIAGKTLDYSHCYPRGSFDKQSMAWDLNYFKYYFLRLAKIPFDEQSLENDFNTLSEFLLSVSRDYFLYRDFQSRNIMVKDGSPYFIDYQGGRKGALQYDIASLLFDAKADLPFSVREELLERYIKAAGALVKIDRADFLRHYHGYVYIRIMQAMGTYGLRGFYERKTQFLQSIPYAVRNLEYLLRKAKLPVQLPALTAVWKRIVASSALRQYGAVSLKLTVHLQSFSYRNGIPLDETGHGGGHVFDCRGLPNPGRFERYAKLSGKDADVVDYLRKEVEVEKFFSHVLALIDQAADNYRSRNFTDLSVAFGCTGGQHRSVYCAELLAKHLRARHFHVELRHLELEKKKEAAA